MTATGFRFTLLQFFAFGGLFKPSVSIQRNVLKMDLYIILIIIGMVDIHYSSIISTC
jgi:hypothetical protein